MITKLNLNLVVNPLSIGQVGYNIARELYRRKVQCCIFSQAQPNPKTGSPFDLTPFKPDAGFAQWLHRSYDDRLKKFDRSVPTFACWHLAGSELKPSDRQYLLTFHETDSPTEYEVNIANQQDRTFFSSSWSVDQFQQYGATTATFLPLGLDEDFQVIPYRQVSNDITHWGLVGKWELRKNTELIIATWIKRYGGNPKHQLTLCVDNPFIVKERMGYDMNALYGKVFGPNKPFNVNVLPHLKTNVEMNQLYNSFDVDLSGFSSAEGFGLPAFTATALGKWSIVTNCTAHKDWATAANSIQVEPTSMKPVYDGVFFGPGGQFNQGNVYSFTADQLNEAMDRAEKVAKTPNPAGRELATQFTYKRTVDQILAAVEA